MEVIMFVGIPASGKSTQSAKYRQQGYRILSSDEIREDLINGANLESLPEKEKAQLHSRVFEIIRKEAVAALDDDTISIEQKNILLKAVIKKIEYSSPKDQPHGVNDFKLRIDLNI